MWNKCREKAKLLAEDFIKKVFFFIFILWHKAFCAAKWGITYFCLKQYIPRWIAVYCSQHCNKFYSQFQLSFFKSLYKHFPCFNSCKFSGLSLLQLMVRQKKDKFFKSEIRKKNEKQEEEEEMITSFWSSPTKWLKNNVVLWNANRLRIMSYLTYLLLIHLFFTDVIFGAKNWGKKSAERVKVEFEMGS